MSVYRHPSLEDSLVNRFPIPIYAVYIAKTRAMTVTTKDNSLVEIVFNGVIFQTRKSDVLMIKIVTNFVLSFLVVYWGRGGTTYTHDKADIYLFQSQLINSKGGVLILVVF